MQRIARVEGINLETGEFSMVLATEGEASDGHILSIKGGDVPERMPLLNSHFNSPTEALGSVTNPVKDLKATPPVLRATGQIELLGDGPQAAIRRDLAHMIDKGHVTGVSIRWDEVGGKATRRTALPKDHPHYVGADDAGRGRFGVFFEEWRALEGSVVALPADRDAMIGRAEETEGEVREFWRSMAEEAFRDNLMEKLPLTIERGLAVLGDLATSLRIEGVPPADLINAVTVESDGEDFKSVRIGGLWFYLPTGCAETLESERAIAEHNEERIAEMRGENPHPDLVTDSITVSSSDVIVDENGATVVAIDDPEADEALQLTARIEELEAALAPAPPVEIAIGTAADAMPVDPTSPKYIARQIAEQLAQPPAPIEDEPTELDQAPETDELADLRLRVELLESDLASAQAAPEPVVVTEPEIVSPRDLAALFKEELAKAGSEVLGQAREDLQKALGAKR